ncbi:hypothetical protein KKF34_17810 [Myxococcota bacterium]|nr:hypothetical protein [Myxococcota bacterium]MBU1382170.1 hypothetical protein [Myxococcota bacterium]MBU1498740.1 hypothetical protein [Myxococcota bacterium]
MEKELEEHFFRLKSWSEIIHKELNGNIILRALKSVRDISVFEESYESWTDIELTVIFKIAHAIGLIKNILLESNGDPYWGFSDNWDRALDIIGPYISDDCFNCGIGLPQDLRKNRYDLSNQLSFLEQEHRKEAAQFLGIKQSSLRMDLVVGKDNPGFNEIILKSGYFNLLENSQDSWKYRLGSTPKIDQVLEKLNKIKKQTFLLEKKLFGKISREIWLVLRDIYKSDLELLGKLDMCNALAIFNKEYNCCIPIIEDKNSFVLKGGVHPWIKKQVEHCGGTYTPVTVLITSQLVNLTGPNMGGKSSFLRTAGFFQALFQMGAGLPCTSFSSRLFKSIRWLGSVSDSPEKGLSSFGREIRDLITSLDGSDYFLLFDEFARSTDVESALALTKALFDYIKVGDHNFAIFAGHIHEAGKHPGVLSLSAGSLKNNLHKIKNAELTLNILNNLMDYTIFSGDEVKKNDAILIAGILGLPMKIIESAEKYLKS